jgi:hypothetical protein
MVAWREPDCPAARRHDRDGGMKRRVAPQDKRSNGRTP